MMCALAGAASAQEVIPDFYKGPGLDPNRGYVNQSFSEHIDPFNGSLQLHYVDINLPGNGGFDIQVARSYNSASVNESNPNVFFGSAGVGWSVHFGRVLFKTSVGPCGASLWPDVLRDPILELPDGSTQILATSSTASATLISTRRWRADCTSGMTVYSPEGIRYDMTQAVSVPNGSTSPFGAYYTTKITDRNGNYATITYTQPGSPEVSSVATSDGRRIDFSYYALTASESTRRINTVTSIDSTGNRTYTYGYTAIAGNFGGFQLTSVTRPDGLQWSYRYLANLNASVPGGFQLNGVTYPGGATITYGYGSAVSDYVYFDSVTNAQSRTSVIKSKNSSDGGNWTFAYVPGSSGSYDTTTVNTPSGTVTYKHVGPNYASSGSLWMVGLLMQKQIGSVQTETYGWTPQVISTQQFKRPGAWSSTRLDANTSAPTLSSKTIVRDGASHSTTFSSFDSYGNPATVVESGPNGGSRTTTLTYYQNTALWILSQPKNQSVSGGVQISRTFDGLGNLISSTRDGVTTTYDRCGDGSVSQTTFPRSLVHTYACNNYKRGIAQSESQPENVSLVRTVSDSGNVLSERNVGQGSTTSYTYDGLNRLTRITPPLGNATVISYGQTTKSATRGSLTETTVYDGFGRPTTVTLGGIARTYQYDTLGRTTFVSNPGGNVGTSYQYDILDRVTSVINADSTNRVMSFGAGAKTVRDERGYYTTYNYRAFGDPGQQLLMSIAASDTSANLTIERNARDQVTTVTQGGFTRTYGYDSRGFLTSVVNPETGTTIYGRDDADNMTSRKVDASATATFGYDGQNRMASAVYPGADSVTKTYSFTSKLATVTSSSATRVYGYDANDNLKTESLTIDGLLFTLAYDYNLNDQLNSLTYPRSSRIISFNPDILGRPTTATGFVNNVAYWPSGQIYQVTYANLVVSTYGQDSKRLWPNSFQTTKGASSYLNSAYTYDGIGNLATVTDGVDSGFNRTLGYDSLNRLTSASGPWGSGTLTYDGTGNLKSQTFGGANLTYMYGGADNRLNSVNGYRSANYRYDIYGNIADTGSQTYSYDNAMNMICANCADPATRVQYQYDGLNQRVSYSKGGVKTYEFYAINGSLLTELTPSLSNRMAEYVYLGGKRVATVGPSPSTISLPASTLTAVAGQVVTFTATLTGASPTGSVSFYDGSTALGTTGVVVGKASVTTTFQSPGMRTLTANYGGDGANFGSSAVASVKVLGATTVTGPAGGPNLNAVAGRPTTLTASINGIAPTGTISFYDGSTLLGTATLVSGSGSISATIATAGTHTITMVYGGDATNAPSSATVTMVVSLAPEQLIPILEMLLED